MQKLKELAREHQVKRRPEEWVAEWLSREDWKSLSRDARLIAARRLKGGKVLPDGYDAESVAEEAIADVLAGRRRVGLGCTRARLVRTLERLIWGKIRNLELRKEAAVVRGQWGEDGKSIVGNVRDEGLDGYQRLVAREAEREREDLRQKLRGLLSGEPELASLFECRWMGMTNPGEIGRRLGMSEVEVMRARRRLDRRMAEWRKARG